MRISDWSSDVCSSDLTDRRLQADLQAENRAPAGDFPGGLSIGEVPRDDLHLEAQIRAIIARYLSPGAVGTEAPRRAPPPGRSEERRVGKEGGSTGRSRGSPYHKKKKKNSKDTR